MATGFYIQGLGIVGSLVFVVSGAVVIDGNGDGIWWQVLAVAFCIGQQLVVGVGATVRKLYHATALRHSATRAGHTSK